MASPLFPNIDLSPVQSGLNSAFGRIDQGLDRRRQAEALRDQMLLAQAEAAQRRADLEDPRLQAVLGGLISPIGGPGSMAASAPGARPDLAGGAGAAAQELGPLFGLSVPGVGAAPAGPYGGPTGREPWEGPGTPDPTPGMPFSMFAPDPVGPVGILAAGVRPQRAPMPAPVGAAWSPGQTELLTKLVPQMTQRMVAERYATGKENSATTFAESSEKRAQLKAAVDVIKTLYSGYQKELDRQNRLQIAGQRAAKGDQTALKTLTEAAKLAQRNAAAARKALTSGVLAEFAAYPQGSPERNSYDQATRIAEQSEALAQERQQQLVELGRSAQPAKVAQPTARPAGDLERLRSMTPEQRRARIQELEKQRGK